MAKEKQAKPWERQENETPKQFEAFVIYRDMGEERSLQNVANQLAKSRQLLTRWSSANNWVERSRAWDNEQDRLLRIEQIKDIKKMRKRHADTGTLMVAVAQKALQKMIDPKTKELRDDITANEISRLVEVGSKLERLSRGDTSEVIEERQGEAVDAVQIYVPDNNRGRDKETFDDLEV